MTSVTIYVEYYLRYFGPNLHIQYENGSLGKLRFMATTNMEDSVMRFLLSVLLMSLFLSFSAPASAISYSAYCHGCSDSQMANEATQTTNDGIVWVFNSDDRIIKKYQVFTEVIDVLPYTVWTQAISQPVPNPLKNAFIDFVDSAAAMSSETIVLPPEFPFATVAGALHDPETFIQRFTVIINDPEFYSRAQALKDLVEEAAENQVPVDLGQLKEVDTWLVEFSDESKIRVEQKIVDGRYTGESVPGSGIMKDGTFAPSGPSSTAWDGFSYSGNSTQLGEWLRWAASNGVNITGWDSGKPPAPGSAMTCSSNPGGTPFCRLASGS